MKPDFGITELPNKKQFFERAQIEIKKKTAKPNKICSAKTLMQHE